jgi:hypothetical protein
VFVIIGRGLENELELDVYSPRAGDLQKAELSVQAAGCLYKTSPLPTDSQGWSGLKITVADNSVRLLEARLQVKFVGLRQVDVRLTGPTNYRCTQITQRGAGVACVNLFASSDADAALKCALLANQRRWLGGDATPGTCGP